MTKASYARLLRKQAAKAALLNKLPDSEWVQRCDDAGLTLDRVRRILHETLNDIAEQIGQKSLGPYDDLEGDEAVHLDRLTLAVITKLRRRPL